MTVEESTQRLAYISALQKLLSTAEQAEKSFLLGQRRRRTEHAIDDNDQEIATVVVKYLNADAKPKARISDESVVLPWLIEEFGEQNVETVTRITEQGRTSAEEFATAEFIKSGKELPGIVIVPAAEKKLSVAVTPVKDIVDRVQGMVDRGALNLAAEVAALTARPEPGEPE